MPSISTTHELRGLEVQRRLFAHAVTNDHPSAGLTK
jgi:hypothetical protein